jgi:hypothetical protein
MTRTVKWGVLLLVIVLASVASVPSALPSAGKTLPATKVDDKPQMALIDRFDEAIQLRFLDVKMFGMYRIMPPNPHLRTFSPNTPEEREVVQRFIEDGWRVDLYLFGRRSRRKVVNGKEEEKFTTTYRLNEPVAITPNVNTSELPKSDTMLHRVKVAFDSFQLGTESTVLFDSAGWSYVARPVRATNAKCLDCHVDHVATSTTTNNQPTFRQRRVGDVNGVILYGFRKD